MNFPLSISPRKEMGDSTEQTKQSLTSVGNEPLIFGFDDHCSTVTELVRGQTGTLVMGDHGHCGNCGNVNVKGTMNVVLQCTNDINDGSKINSVSEPMDFTLNVNHSREM